MRSGVFRVLKGLGLYNFCQGSGKREEVPYVQAFSHHCLESSLCSSCPPLCSCELWSLNQRNPPLQLPFAKKTSTFSSSSVQLLLSLHPISLSHSISDFTPTAFKDLSPTLPPQWDPLYSRPNPVVTVLPLLEVARADLLVKVQGPFSWSELSLSSALAQRPPLHSPAPVNLSQEPCCVMWLLDAHWLQPSKVPSTIKLS